MPKAIGELIPGIMRQTTRNYQAILQLQRGWVRVVGKALAVHTKPVSLRRGTLYVHTNDPGASFTLSLEQPRLLERLRKTTPCRIDEIVIRAGAVS